MKISKPDPLFKHCPIVQISEFIFFKCLLGQIKNLSASPYACYLSPIHPLKD